MWTEFRYETRFVSPELQLSAMGDKPRPELCITDHKLEPKTNPIPSKRWWINFTRRSRLDVVGAMRGALGKSLYPEVLTRGKEPPLSKDPNSSDDLEQGSAGTLALSLPSTPLLRKDNKTSWLVLLPQAREVYSQYEAAYTPQTQYLNTLSGSIGPDSY